MTTQAQPLLKCVALTAFGNMPKTSLLRLGQFLHPDAVAGLKDKPLLELLVHLAKELSGVTDDLEILKLLRRRTLPTSSSDVYQALLEEDTVLDIMDRDDKQEAERQIVSGKFEEAARLELHRSLKERKAIVKASGVGRKKARTTNVDDGIPKAIRAWKGPKELLLEIPEQYEVRGLLPPGAHIWKANSHFAWAAYLSPWPRTSASWQLYDHREALRRVLATVWQQYLDDNDLTPAACPIRGFFRPPSSKKRQRGVVPRPAPGASRHDRGGSRALRSQERSRLNVGGV